MNNQFIKAVVAGFIATVAMTLMMMLAALMGMPKMDPPQMLATTMNTSVVLGWVMHFMIGIVFALMYTYFFQSLLANISSVLVKGLLFGLIAFVIAQIGMLVMGAMFPSMPEPQGSRAMMIVGSLLGHLLFGIVVTYAVHRGDATAPSQDLT